MARLAGEVEQEVLALDQSREAVLVTDVRDVHVHLVLEAADIGAVPSVLGHEGVDEHDLGVGFDEFARERRADEAETTGDEDALAGE